MRSIFIWLFLMNWMLSVAQQSAIKGVISIHNSETFTGKRQYVTNAQVEDDFKKATSTVTNNNGEFTLVFVGVNEKKTVSFQVKKQGLAIVDQTKLSAVAGQETVVNISMANPDSIDAYRFKLFEIGKTEAQKNLEKALQEKNRQLTILRKDALKNANAIKQLQEEYASLEEKNKKIEELAEELAKRYAPVNLDDASTLFKQAFFLFQQGKLDSALTVLSNANVAGVVSDIISEREQIKKLKIEISTRDSLQKVIGDDAAKALLLKADLHKTKFEFDSTLNCFELLVKLEPDNPDFVFQYGYLLQFLNRHDKAISHYESALEIYRQHAKDNPRSYEEDIATIQNNLGILYRDKKEYNKSEAALLEALETSKRLVKYNRKVYQPLVATIQINLGFLYHCKEEFNKAEATYLDALQAYNRLAKNNPQAYESDVASLQNHLGLLYVDKKEFSKAETAYLDALEIYKRLAKSNPHTYEAELAAAQTNLGMFYNNKYEFNKGEAVCLGALEIYKQFAKNNPQTYEPGVAMVQHNLGLIYMSKGEFDKAETFYLDALEINTRLAKDNPQVYEPNLAKTRFNLEANYIFKKEYNKAEAIHSETLKIITRLAKDYPEAYDPLVGRYTTMLAFLSGLQSWYLLLDKKFNEAEQMAIKGLDFDKKVSWIKINLAHSLLFQRKYGEALNVYQAIKTEIFIDGRPFSIICLEDLNELEKRGITNNDVAKIREFLKQE